MPNTSPITAWKSLRQGNDRFVAGEPAHPSQDTARRTQLVAGQHPTAVIFGCGDSRVAAELIFDQGLGDTFIVRTAGHVIDSSVLGSIEYAIEILNVPLIVVLGHDSCGAVAAAINAVDKGDIPGGFIRSVVERVIPSILSGRRDGHNGADELEAWHVVETGRLLLERSSIIAERVADGRLGIVGATYALDDGRVLMHEAVGTVE